MDKKVFLSWEDVDSLLESIYNQIKDKGITQVSGIPRGGLIPAILFSHKYGYKYLHTPDNRYSDLLIFDDISDTGETLEKWMPNYPNPLFATLHNKLSASRYADYTGLDIPDDFGWVVYPWENKNSKTIQDYLDN